MMMIMIKPTQQPNQQPETNVNVRTWITCIDFYTAKESRLGGDSDKREEDFTAYGLQTHTHTFIHCFPRKSSQSNIRCAVAACVILH